MSGRERRVQAQKGRGNLGWTGLLLGLLTLMVAVPGPVRADELRDKAAAILIGKSCIGCHIVPGVPEATGQIGPNLAHLKKKRRFAGDKLANTPENVRRWLRNPKEIKMTMMPNLHLTEDEITILIAYFDTL